MSRHHPLFSICLLCSVIFALTACGDPPGYSSGQIVPSEDVEDLPDTGPQEDTPEPDPEPDTSTPEDTTPEDEPEPPPLCEDDMLGDSSSEEPLDLPPRVRLDGLVACEGETDWFHVALSDGDALSMRLEVLEEAAIEIKIFEGDQLATELRLGQGNQTLRHTDETGQGALIAISAEDARALYNLEVEVTPGVPDDCLDTSEEPNEAPTEAFEVETPLSLEATICDGDTDWYAFDLPAGETLTTAIFFAHAGGDLDMKMYQMPDLEEIGVSESTADEERLQAGPFNNDTRILLEVFGFRDATNPYRLDAQRFGAADFEAGFEGQITLEDKVHDAAGFTGELNEIPARGIVLEVVRSLDGATVATGLTDAEGLYALTYSAHEGQTYTLRVLAAVEVGGYRAIVRDRTEARAIYAMEGDPVVPVPGQSERVDMRASHEDAVGGALHIADVTGEGFRFIAGFTERGMPPLTYRWAPGEAFGCGSCFSDNTISLGGQLEDPDEFDDDIILHEFGHYFVQNLSADSSPGGSHRDRQVSPRLAYGEGLAYFFACLVQDDPLVVDNFLGDVRTIDLEAVTQQMESRDDFFGTNNGEITGELREEIVGAIMWDAFDPASEAEPFDRVEIGAEGHMRLLLETFGGEIPPNIGARGIDLIDWLNAASCTFPEIEAPLSEIVEDREWPWEPDEHIDCDRKGTLDALIGIEATPTGLHIVAKAPVSGPLKLRVFHNDGQRAQWRDLTCNALPCLLATNTSPHSAIAVVGRHEGRFIGASHVGTAALARMLGAQARSALSPESGPLRVTRASHKTPVP